jgi:hypothetical protein
MKEIWKAVGCPIILYYFILSTVYLTSGKSEEEEKSDLHGNWCGFVITPDHSDIGYSLSHSCIVLSTCCSRRASFFGLRLDSKDLLSATAWYKSKCSFLRGLWSSHFLSWTQTSFSFRTNMLLMFASAFCLCLLSDLRHKKIKFCFLEATTEASSVFLKQQSLLL